MATSPSSNFDFLLPAWPALHAEAAKAESLVYPDPRTSCFYSRRALETALHWLYKSEAKLSLPYQENLSALIHEPSFLAVAGQAVVEKAKLINRSGNVAVHHSAPVPAQQAFDTLRELFHLTFWLARRYGATPPPDTLYFDSARIPRATSTLELTVKLQCEAQQKLAELAASHETALASQRTSLTGLLAERENLLTGKLELDAELLRLRAEVAALVAANTAQPDTHDYDEAATRDSFIDLLLKEAGWNLDEPYVREYAVAGMPTPSGRGKVDYVLWAPDGLPLAVVEAKRTRRDAKQGQQQAKLYADALEAKFGQRPVIFYTNGYEYFLWDDLRYPPRNVQGFYTLDELTRLVQRRTSRKSLLTVPTDTAIAERYYQERAIRKVADDFEQKHLRKALLVMATGSGKTRTVIALADLLMRANWAGRILFLADRVALVKQAANAFKKHLPGATTVNLVTERGQTGHVYISTYPTMMNLIDQAATQARGAETAGSRRFGTGFFDLIVVDEAHRSIYQKYGAIFDYFDTLLVGLTATPRTEINRNTYGLFDLEEGVPTDEYSLAQAITDKFLVPYRVRNTPVRIPNEGIRYDDLSLADKDRWDALEWSDDGSVPTVVEPPEVHSWFFNTHTVDLVLADLMGNGIKVAEGDRLGKTILFAKNQAHANFIAERFDFNYPHLAGRFARVITHAVEFAATLIDDFSQPEKAPHLAVSVDMLDTGIDVPEVVNLAFFKSVRSRTKFWQMIGRGTRLSPNLFGPGKDKTEFLIFDYCRNFEYFGMNPDAVEGSSTVSLSARLFTRRVELLAEIDRRAEAGIVHTEAAESLRAAVAELLRSQVGGMSLDTFEVRPHRRLVELYSRGTNYARIDAEQRIDLDTLAALPSAVTDADGPAKVFDHLILRMQLAMLRVQPAFTKLAEKVVDLARILEGKSAIPMVAAQRPLVEEIQTPDYWRSATLASLEDIRLRLRALIKLIEPERRPLVITSFTDDLLPDTPVADHLGAATPGVDMERLRAKARHFLVRHDHKQSIQRLKWNQQLTSTDLTELEGIFAAEGTTQAEMAAAMASSSSLGLFVRSLVGLDRTAARKAFEAFLSGRTLSANQHQFIDLIVEYLTRRGFVDPVQVYQTPFTNSHPEGVAGLFRDEEVASMLSILTAIRQNAVVGNHPFA